jgi:hypothetical protein
MKSNLLFLIGLIAMTHAVDAHVVLDYPTGGESLHSGQLTTIKWHVTIGHDQDDWDIYYSGNGGESWEIIAIDLPKSWMEYSWVVPEGSTDSARIRIVMDNVAGSYQDISNNFMVLPGTIPTGDIQTNREMDSFSSYPNPAGEINYYSIGLKKGTQVTIELFNIAGSRQKTILHKQLEPGKYEGIWYAQNLPDGLYLIRMIRGNQTEVRKLVLRR